MEQQAETEPKHPLEFSNETLKVKAHFKPNCKVELEIHASPSIVKEAHRKAVKDGRQRSHPSRLSQRKSP